MKSYTKKGSGWRWGPMVDRPPLQFLKPATTFRPVNVRISNSRLWAPPSPNQPPMPPEGFWRNLVGLEGHESISTIATLFGPLSPEGAGDAGELVALWDALFRDLGAIAQAWNDDGSLPSDYTKRPTPWVEAQRMQQEMATRESTRFTAMGQAGWVLVTETMADLWRLCAISALYAGRPLLRCRHCRGWFSVNARGRRLDAGFCCLKHKSAFHQGRSPGPESWLDAVP